MAGFLVQLLQQKVQKTSAISDWYRVRFFYASNAKKKNDLGWHDETFQRWRINQLDERRISLNLATEITGYAQSEDKRIGFIVSVEITGDVFNWRLKLRTLILCFQNNQSEDKRIGFIVSVEITGDVFIDNWNCVHFFYASRTIDFVTIMIFLCL